MVSKPHADMTIRDIRTHLVRLDWASDPWMAGHALGFTRELLVLEVETQGGLIGLGYLHPLSCKILNTVAACIEEVIVPRVIGRDATEVEALWRELWRATTTAGRGGVTTMAQSALDIALWIWSASGPRCRCTASGAITGRRSRSMAAAAGAAATATE